MELKKKRAKFFEARYFGLILGFLIAVTFIMLNTFTPIFKNVEVKVHDIHFRYKNLFMSETEQEGVNVVKQNPNISPDILIVGIDFRTLSKFGRWPFPRYTHSYLLNTLSRIKNQNERERSVLLDIFFNEPSNAVDDGILIDSIKENGRVFLETILDEVPPPAASKEDFYKRQDILYKKYGEIKNIVGDWENMISFAGLQPPLQPYAAAAHGYGHPNYIKDSDEIFRRQHLVAKSSIPIREIRLQDLTPDLKIDHDNFQRLAWTDKSNKQHSIKYPLTDKTIETLKKEMEQKAPLKTVDSNNDGTPDESYYVVRVYQDHFVPAITLSLALDYFNKKLSDIEVKLGKYIFIPHPQKFNTKTGLWEPYKKMVTPPQYKNGKLVKEAEYEVIKEIKIPIDKDGTMLVNFMGPPSFASMGERQTFPVRSYSGYASNPPGLDPARWPATRALGNKIVMVGSFTRGMAADEKPTPYGLMYGVEIHANALNTILMNNFLVNVPFWVDALILLFMVMFIAFIASRLSTIWAFVATIVLIIALFIVDSQVFDEYAYIINFTVPASATFFTLITIIIYRIMTEEKDKKRIRNMFGTYVSPAVVDQILENPPELGGQDKELTVFFSDIRGFTTLSESMTPQELVKILNKYLTAMTDIILAHGGTLDKYEGDAIMCFWGAPLPQEDHALRACRSALEQMKALKELNKEFPEEKQINIGIGLNSGIMTVGNMGSLQRMDYTLIGDNVNLGARLEGTNKQYRTNIIISEYTYGLVKDKMIVRELDNIRVKGKNKPVLIYELIDEIDESSDTGF